MTPLARRASPFVALLLLVIVSTASAECSWVLWTALSIPAMPDEGWGVVTAYPAMQECETALAKEFLRLKREGWEVYYVQVRTVMAFQENGEEIIATHYHCLPDTVDPRGPKGK